MKCPCSSPSSASSRSAEVLQLFRSCVKTPALATLPKTHPLILRHLGTQGLYEVGIFTLEANLCNTSVARRGHNVRKGTGPSGRVVPRPGPRERTGTSTATLIGA